MDYGSAVYLSARKSCLKKLDIVHNAGVRYATGAFRTSPSISLHCEAGMMSLQLRRQLLLLRYVAKILTLPRHLNHVSIVKHKLAEVYSRRHTPSRPASIRALELCRCYNIQVPSVQACAPCKVPPWLLKELKCRLDVASRCMNSCSSTELKLHFLSVIEEYLEDHTIIYTDGSKTENGVGSAFVEGGSSHSGTLPNTASVYTAELYAVWQTLRYCEHRGFTKIIICTDSLSFLTALNNSDTTDPLLQQIMSVCHMLETGGSSLVFVWTPSHVGIVGNEEADAVARLAADSPEVDDISIRPEDAKIAARSAVMKSWQRTWDTL